METTIMGYNGLCRGIWGFIRVLLKLESVFGGFPTLGTHFCGSLKQGLYMIILFGEYFDHAYF